MSKIELVEYIKSESDQVIEDNFTLYFMKLHTLLHSK